MGTISDALKKQLLQQTQEHLFNLAKGVGPRLQHTADQVAGLLQNDWSDPTQVAFGAKEIAILQGDVETEFVRALEQLTEILTIAAQLKQGNLPS
jgi:flagellar basal body rod protein FlgF